MTKERTVLIGISDYSQGISRIEMQEHLEELALLVKTAGGEIFKTFTQHLEKSNPKTYIGVGKLNEVNDFIKSNDIDTVIFDDELSAAQFRNLENELKIKILDRTNLILDIFAKRAQTAHAKTQVELAQYQYLLPRLTRMWTHLERQQGGIGMRGPGEKEIETDRRIIRDKIAKLKKDLLKIDRQKSTQRKNRGKLVRVALVGYTNAGKSTLMNVLSKSKIYAEDKPFATLDTTVRKVVISNLPFLMADTVGFIRKLPHHLIESFKSTLDEVREADILLHVVDVSHPNFEEQIEIVNQTLHDIDSNLKQHILVLNKMDAFTFEKKDDDDLTPMTNENYSLNELKQIWFAKNELSVFISATKKTNIEKLKQMLFQMVYNIHITRYPYNDFLFHK